MNLNPYRQTLALPGLRPLLLVSVLARIPFTATGLALTFYVLLELDRGYGAAGLVGAATTVGSALGGPLLGRMVDRYGLRPVLALTIVAEAVFWSTAALLPYPVLVGVAFLGGLLNLPLFSVIRQSIAAITPPDQRRPAYALDSMSVELSYMVGPALAVALATGFSPHVTLYAVGAGIVLSGITLFLLDPPTRSSDEPAGAAPPPGRRVWLTPRLLGVLATGTACTLIVGGTDVALVAALREAGQVGWTGLVLAVWAVASLAGGFAYGAFTRSVSPLMLLAGLGLTTIPVGLAGGNWWLLGLAMVPAGLLCAPTITATADTVSRLAPAGARGEAMGLHGSALTVGVAIGTPLAGAVIDHRAAGWGFAVAGLIGLLVALAALPAELGHRRRQAGQRPDADPAGGEQSAPGTPTDARAGTER